MKTPLTETEALHKAAAYCAQTERCTSEVEEKLKAWEVDPEVTERVMAQLQAERFVDDARFATAYALDKFRFARWGKLKIAQALRLKRLPTAEVDAALEAIDVADYRKALLELAKAKARTIKGRNDYECKAKLARFLVGRGFEWSLVATLLDVDE